MFSEHICDLNSGGSRRFYERHNYFLIEESTVGVPRDTGMLRVAFAHLNSQ